MRSNRLNARRDKLDRKFAKRSARTKWSSYLFVSVRKRETPPSKYYSRKDKYPRLNFPTLFAASAMRRTSTHFPQHFSRHLPNSFAPCTLSRLVEIRAKREVLVSPRSSSERRYGANPQTLASSDVVRGRNKKTELGDASNENSQL